MKKDDESQQQTKSASANPSSPGSKPEALEEKLRWVQESQALAVRILNLLNGHLAASDAIREILGILKNFTGFEAVGIRLRDGDDYPYFETQGFPGHFVDAENSLCARNEEGEIIRNSAGYPIMECMCGNVLQGRADPSLPFFTRGGSFWTNCTTELLATTSEEERQSRTRDRCNGEGYESVALVPLRSDREIIGLLQLNDSRKNCFTLDMIEFFEGICASIGIVLSHKRVEQERDRLFNLSIDMLGIVGFDGFYKDVNPAFTKSLGWAKEEFLSKPWIEFVHPEDQEETITALERLKSGEPLYQFRNRCQHKDGTYRWISWDSFSISDENMIFTAARDVTERKQMEEALTKVRDELEQRVDKRTVTLTETNEKLALEISERRRAEKALRLEREQLLAIFDSIDEVISVVDAETYEILYANKFMRDRQGKELIGGVCYKDLHGLTKPCDHCTNGIVSRLQGKPYRWEYHNPTANRDYLATDRIIKWTDGRDAKFHLGIDITERKKVEEALRKSEEKYRNLFEKAPIGIFQSTLEGNILSVNPAYAKMHGYESPEEVISGVKDVAAQLYRHPERRRQIVEKALKQDRLLSVENEYRRKDGTVLTGNLHLQVMRNKDGSVSHLEGFVEDITDRKDAEHALRESEKRYRELVEKANDIIHRTDANGFFVLFNPAGLRVTGYSHEEISHMHYLDLIHPDYKKQVERFYGLQFVKRIPDTYYEVPIITKQGKTVWIGQRVQLVTEGEAVVGFQSICRDVTERKKAEELLRQAERRYRHLFEDAPLMYVITRPEHGVPFITDCNGPFLSSLGYLREEVVGQPVTAFYSPTSISALLEGGGYARALAGEFLIGERQLLRRDGSLVPTLLYTAPEVDSSGRVAGTCAMYVDITKQKKVEEALRESEQRYRAIFDIASVGIDLVDRHGQFLDVNGTLSEFLGYTPEELRNLTILEVTYPEDVDRSREMHEALVQGKAQWYRLEKSYVRKDGSILWSDTTVSAIRGADGQYRATVGVIRDITQRKKSEEARIRLAAAVEQAAETVLITDAHGTIVYTNPAFERTTGYPPGEAIGENPRILKSGHHDDEFYKRMWDTLTEGKVWTGHITNKKRDGTLFEEDASISPVKDDSGQITNYVAVKRDVTREVSLQKQLLHAQKMEAIGTLAGGIAHDFNNLLQVTLGYSELLLAEKKEEDPEYSDLSKILQSARNGAELVQRLLTFSRKVEPKPIPLNLNRRILQVEKLLRRTIPKMIDIQMDLSDDLAKVYADPTQIEQILMNLAVNARDAMPDRGKLTVGTKNVTLDDEYCRVHAEAKPGEYVLLNETASRWPVSRLWVE